MLGEISISNGIPVQNSRMLGHLFSLQPQAIMLVHFVKKWIDSQPGFGGLQRYTIVLMVMFFLQKQDFMPSIEKVQKGCEPKLGD